MKHLAERISELEHTMGSDFPVCLLVYDDGSKKQVDALDWIFSDVRENDTEALEQETRKVVSYSIISGDTPINQKLINNVLIPYKGMEPTRTTK
ncbi:MAG: hypothetical protein LKF79_07670 [Solobacterium sp.]|jgi:hypothetical protein|nr:hypothetical protein [Solobacterium sp.]